MWKFFFLLISLVIHVYANFNFFVTEDEMFKLLGIRNEVYYVNKGAVNDYALNFVVMIPANISDIQFSWQSLVNHSLSYILVVSYDGQGALLPPQMNITSTGFIPTTIQTFRIRLICTGTKSAEIEVRIHLNVAFPHQRQNGTVLSFKRNKICQKGSGSSFRNDSIRLDLESLENATGSLYFAVACAVAMITLVVITTSAVCIKNKKVRSQDTHYMSAVYDNNQHVFVRLSSSLRRTSSIGSGSYATIASIQKAPPSPYATSDSGRVSYYASSQVMLLSKVGLQDPRDGDTHKRLRDLAIPKHSIKLDELIEEGVFGQTYRAYFKGHNAVMVKTTKETASLRQINLFLREGTMLYEMDHKNVLTVLGINIEDPKRPFIIYPYVNKGNLKRYLIRCRHKDDYLFTPSTQSIVDIALQVLLGIMYLHSQCICHKDIATRNCVIDDKLQVKVADSALSRDLFPNDYFCLNENESRPIKWLALESLLQKEFSGATDVWSFGVLLWELTTMAHQPYSEIDPFEMASHLRNGYRLPQPIGCPDELFAIMSYCWLANATERPKLPQLLSNLQELYSTLCRFI